MKTLLILFTIAVRTFAFAGELESLLEPGATVKKLAGNFKFTEGPAWSPAGFLVFSDIPANTLYRWLPGGEIEIFRTPSGHANGNAFDRQGRLVSCEHDRRVSRLEKDGTSTCLADRFDGKRFNSPNDLAIKSDGAIYFTDPPYGLEKADVRDLDFCGVFRIAPDGTVTLLAKDFIKPNGLAFSPDEKLLYVDDTERREVRVFDVQPNGALANGRLFAGMKDPANQDGPDGMRVDSTGNLWCTGAGGVWVFTPAGKLLGVLATPEEPANLAFGRNNRHTLFITARTGLYSIETKVAGKE